tara:strand:+ start:966 stop:1487 length:522 start_codon:yes stop_codon:yes gene_type:complete
MAATINATLKSATANSFVTLAEADAYFETVPSSTQWDNKSDDNKNRALISATRWIDTLNFYGDRCDTSQALNWPRNNYHVDRVELVCSSIPNDIKYATYELARALANDTDSITGTTGDTGLYDPSNSERWKSSTTLLVKLLELLTTYSTFILGFSLISALTAWVAVVRIKFAL